MGLMDNLRKLTQPYGDEEDYFEGADGAYVPQDSPVSDAQLQFESGFAAEPASAPEPAQKKPRLASGGSLFGGHGSSAEKQSTPPRQSRASRRGSSGGGDASVIRFNPKDFDEAGELVTFLDQGRSLIMSLEDIPSDTARRLLDFMSGIAYAMDGKINPVSAKTYFITPENVDLLDAQASRNSGEFE